jgi:hypothetical protein
MEGISASKDTTTPDPDSNETTENTFDQVLKKRSRIR